jgi:hypothetical protein
MMAKASNSAAMQDDLQATITAIIARTPDWVRQELLSKEQATRSRRGSARRDDCERAEGPAIRLDDQAAALRSSWAMRSSQIT